MAHEVTKTYEIDGKWHVRPSVGKNKGKTLKIFETEEEANQWAKKRSDDYKPSTKERRKLYEKDPKEWLQLYGDWTK
tara:strand:- start:594 stop:824 length:231 start_codon:yes stop_codon:yes gene_type:complete